MYLLTVKDGLVTRHFGPYVSTKEASDDLDRVLAPFTDRANWQIHVLEAPKRRSLTERINTRDRFISVAAS